MKHITDYKQITYIHTYIHKHYIQKITFTHRERHFSKKVFVNKFTDIAMKGHAYEAAIQGSGGIAQW